MDSRHLASDRRSGFLFRSCVLGILAIVLMVACLPDPSQYFFPVMDLSPPLVLEAGPAGESVFLLLFNEEITPIEGSFLIDPGGNAEAEAEGETLRVLLPIPQEPGQDYLVSGEVADSRGNAARFVFRFVGWNERPARLKITEFEPAKNSSISRPHRDFIEFEVLSPGNLGGMELLTASSLRTTSYRFPSVEVEKGEILLLHLAPEGLSIETDEIGSDKNLSGGIDATPFARDFWSTAGGLPDENGVVAFYERPGGSVLDGVFYANDEKTGTLASSALGTLLETLVDAGLWNCPGQASWEDAFRWHPSSSRSIMRSPLDTGTGSESWYLSSAGGQTPGVQNPPRDNGP